ncbi:hypothetical protein DL770_003671 [Monosporascus sp. CRB-9-2]|nr:hypothetical protein DL770_003671 [Monosporascus sp. CRB-9-2]
MASQGTTNTIMLSELRLDPVMQTFLDCLVNEKTDEAGHNSTQTLDSTINASELVALVNPANRAGAPSAAAEYIKENLMLTEKLREVDRKHDKDQEALRKAHDEADYIGCTSDTSTPTSLSSRGLSNYTTGSSRRPKRSWQMPDALSARNNANAQGGRSFPTKQLDTGIRNLSPIYFETGFTAAPRSDEQTAAFRAVSAAYPLYLEDGSVVGAVCRAFGSVRTSAYGFLEDPLVSAEHAPDLASGVEAIIGAAYELGAAISRAIARYYPIPA